MVDTLKTYYLLTKPGIIRGNVLIAMAGYLLASKWLVDFSVFAAMIAGLSFVIASACVTNNYLDRGIDKHMARTKNRALVTGEVSARAAVTYGTVLGLLGAGALALFTNWVTLLMAALGWFFYVVVYGIGKRKTVHGTVIGSISGSIPPVVGYVAATAAVDLGAVILFLIITFWQMPHFYAIAMYRLDDYREASLPVLPVVSGMKAAKAQSLIYIVLFLGALVALTATGYAGFIFLAIEGLLGLIWLFQGLRGFNSLPGEQWGKRMFIFSLVIISSLSVTISLGSVLP